MQLVVPHEYKLGGLIFYLLREHGIHIYENRAFIMTTAHSDADLDRLTRAFRESLAAMQSAGFLPASSGAEPGVSAGQPPDCARRFPLTEAQKEIWLAAQMGGAAPVAYNESLKLEFRGPFDARLFREAVSQAVHRHPILLASISEDGEWQRLPDNGNLDLPLDDLSGRSEQEQQRLLTEIAGRESSVPFDLSTGPLLRVRLIKLASDHHAVMWTAHHIVCDGWSGGVLVNDLASIYSALRQGAAPKLESPVPFREYVQLSRPESPAAQEALAYWRRQFASPPAALDLPTDRPRPAVRSAKAATFTKRFDPALYQSLRRLAGEQRTTMVALLMAAMKTMLHRLTGQTDLVIGLPLAGQAVTGNHCLVGHCVNLLPIRTKMQPEASFLDNLATVKRNVLDAYDHHQCTIGTVLQHVPVPRDAGRPPLVEVMFNVERDLSSVSFDHVSFSCERNPKRALHYDFFFNFVEGTGELSVECDYNIDLFDEATISRWLARYETLLQGVVVTPAGSLSALPIIPEDERRELMALAAGRRRRVPPGRRFPSCSRTRRGGARKPLRLRVRAAS